MPWPKTERFWRNWCRSFCSAESWNFLIRTAEAYSLEDRGGFEGTGRVLEGGNGVLKEDGRGPVENTGSAFSANPKGLESNINH